MNFYEAVKKNQMIRQFANLPVPNDKLYRVLDAGLKAPSHNRLWEWEFILVEEPAVRHEIVEKAEQLTSSSSDSTVTGSTSSSQPVKATELQRRMLLDAPRLLVVCFHISKSIAECKRVYDLNSFASAWCCLENILLALPVEGLAGATYIPKHTDKIRDILQVPINYEIPAFLAIGFPAENASCQPAKVIPLREKLHIDRYHRR